MSTENATEISLLLNGERRSFAAPLTIAELLAQLPLPVARVAVLRNGEVVPREGHAETSLIEGDTIDLISMVGGG